MLYLFFALTVASPIYSLSAVIGVAPSQLNLYEKPVAGSSPPRWRCLNSSQEIPYSAVNDNYCDCEDGTDEPGTGACPTGLFFCENKGHIGATIRASHVNDGLCEPECCDGSDEPFGICPNVCHVVGEEYRRVQEVERKLRKTGSKIRSSYISFAQKENKRLEQSIASLENEVEVKKAEEARLRDLWEHSASLDEERIALRKKSPTYGLIQEHVDVLEHLTLKQNTLSDRITALENVLSNLKAGYNPNYQDMAVLEAVRGWDALKPEEKPAESQNEAVSEGDSGEATEGEEAEVEETWTEEHINTLKKTDPLSTLLEHERHIAGSSGEDFSTLLFAFDQYIPDSLIPAYEVVRDAIIGTLSKVGLVREASMHPDGGVSDAKKQQHEAALGSLRATEQKLFDENEALKKLFDPEVYGRQGEWRKLKDTCLEKNTGEYTYSVCLFGDATQKSNNGGSNSLGTFKSWSRNPAHMVGTIEYHTQQQYENGARCWNGPERSVKLFLSCGTENALLTIAEPEKCEYHFTGTTPALCWPDADLEASAATSPHTKEDL